MKKPDSSAYHRIMINPGKIQRSKDLFDLSMIHFPQKNAKQMRTAFRIIWNTIRFSQNQRIIWIEVQNFLNELKHDHGIYIDVNQATLCKARKRMRKAGIIEYRNYHWKFSTKFTKSIEHLKLLHSDLQIAIDSKAEIDKEMHAFLYEL